MSTFWTAWMKLIGPHLKVLVLRICKDTKALYERIINEAVSNVAPVPKQQMMLVLRTLSTQVAASQDCTLMVWSKGGGTALQKISPKSRIVRRKVVDRIAQQTQNQHPIQQGGWIAVCKCWDLLFFTWGAFLAFLFPISCLFHQPLGSIRVVTVKCGSQG